MDVVDRVPVPMVGSGGALDGQKLSMRQLRLSKQISNMLTEELMQTPVGSVMEVTEISLSRDLRNVTAYWRYDDEPLNGNPPAGAKKEDGNFQQGSWLCRPKLNKKEQEVSDWLEAATPVFRSFLAQQMPNLKYSPLLCFRYDHAFGHSATVDALLTDERLNSSADNLDSVDEFLTVEVLSSSVDDRVQ